VIDVSEVLNDADVSSAFIINRTTGQFGPGGWQAKGPPQMIQAFGAARNTSGKELEMVPEGDRVSEMITFRSATQMYVTNASGSATSDVLTWLGDNYRVYVVKNYSEQGYFLAIAARTAGE
jgi:hypothetical protein